MRAYLGDTGRCLQLSAGGEVWGGRLGQGNSDNLGDNANEMGDNLPAIDL